MGNSFLMYLRDTGMIREMAQRYPLSGIAGGTWSDRQTIGWKDLSAVDADNTMGNYADEMD